MKKTILYALIVVFALGAIAWAAQKMAVVRTKENYLRASDRFYAPILATVQFEEVLEVLSEKENWLFVRYGEAEGWIHRTAVVQRKPMKYQPVLLGAEPDPLAETDEEVTLAGKGFNAEVEQRVGEMNPELDYAAVDAIAAYSVSPLAVKVFIEDGGLQLPQ